ncbi:hypothetical protein KUCAC02_025859, partial [Chaenocephalus aceratus]
ARRSMTLCRTQIENQVERERRTTKSYNISPYGTCHCLSVAEGSFLTHIAPPDSPHPLYCYCSLAGVQGSYAVELSYNLSPSPHPYPSEEQKKQLAQDTGLTILQVNNW